MTDFFNKVGNHDPATYVGMKTSEAARFAFRLNNFAPALNIFKDFLLDFTFRLKDPPISWENFKLRTLLPPDTKIATGER